MTDTIKIIDFENLAADADNLISLSEEILDELGRTVFAQVAKESSERLKTAKSPEDLRVFLASLVAVGVRAGLDLGAAISTDCKTAFRYIKDDHSNCPTCHPPEETTTNTGNETRH